ncbi:MAG: hypothetical protein WB974_09760, partial [Acidobacteriaceae bacterium]
MTKNLRQVLRIRALLEDRARAELESRTRAVRQLESAAQQERGGAMASRSDAVERLIRGESGAGWQMDLADAEILEWKSERLRAQAEAEKPAAAAARDAMLERRRERRQAETLVEAAERLEQQERVRREQRQVDDWFQGGRSQGRRSRRARSPEDRRAPVR